MIVKINVPFIFSTRWFRRRSRQQFQSIRLANMQHSRLLKRSTSFVVKIINISYLLYAGLVFLALISSVFFADDTNIMDNVVKIKLSNANVSTTNTMIYSIYMNKIIKPSILYMYNKHENILSLYSYFCKYIKHR